MSENNISDLFIIPPEELALRAKRKEQLKIKKQKNKELRATIAKNKAIEKSKEKKNIKKNNEDIDYLKKEISNLKSQKTEKTEKTEKIVAKPEPVVEPVKNIQKPKPIEEVITKEFVIKQYNNDINKKKYDSFINKLKKHL